MQERPLIFVYVKPGATDIRGNIVGMGPPVNLIRDPRTDETIAVVSYPLLNYAIRNRHQPYDYIILEPYDGGI